MGFFNSIRKAINGGKDLFEPVEGCTLENWAEANAKLAPGLKTEELVKQMGMDMTKWDRINNEWLTRMKTDRTYTLSIKYAKIFNNTAKGNLPLKKDFNENTYPFEKYVEAMVAMDVLCKQGRDAQDVLKDFGLTVADYSNLSSYWGKKILFSPMGLGIKFQDLMTQYRAKYEAQAVDKNSDLQF